MKKEIRTEKAPLPGGAYSQGVKIGNRVYIAGQGPMNVETGEIPEGIKKQTEQVLKNIQNILASGDMNMDDVAKVTAHLSDLKNFKEFNEVYSTFFERPYPVRTTVGSQLSGILVEIDVIAEKDE